MSVYILSTMSHAVSYTFYNDVAGLPVAAHRVTILGGSTMPSEKSGFGDMLQTEDGRPIWTADGVVTRISDSDYEKLKDHHVFKSHVEHNHLKVVNHDITENYKEVKRLASGMEDDGKRQLDKKSLNTKVKATTVKGSGEESNRI